MKMRLICSLTLSVGLFMFCNPVFADGDGLRRVQELGNARTMAFIRLFISIAALLLLFYPNSILSSHMRDLRRSTSFTAFRQALSPKLGQGLAFGIDTDMLMQYPDEILAELRKETVLISREVQQELNMLTQSLNQTVAANARRAVRAMEAAQQNGQQLTLLPPAEPGTVKGFGLQDTTDNRIVAAYLKYEQEQGNTCLIARDCGIKLAASTKGLPVLEAAEASPSFQRPSKLFGAILLFMVLLAGSAGYNLLVLLSLG